MEKKMKKKDLFLLVTLFYIRKGLGGENEKK